MKKYQSTGPYIAHLVKARIHPASRTWCMPMDPAWAYDPDALEMSVSVSSTQCYVQQWQMEALQVSLDKAKPEDLPRLAADPGVDPMLREIATALLEQGR